MSISIPQAAFSVAKNNGMVTIHNPATGQHRTFKIRTQKKDASFCPGQRIVSLLTGPDREDFSNWQAFAFVCDDGKVRVWGKKKTPMHEAFGRMLESPESFVAKGAEYMIEGRCRCCNRALTVPESIESGLGPICAGRE